MNISTENGIHVVMTKIGGITVSHIYVPPATAWPESVLQTQPHPALYVGDFNSHHEQWKYRNYDDKGAALVRWTEDENLNLVFDAKDHFTLIHSQVCSMEARI